MTPSHKKSQDNDHLDNFINSFNLTCDTIKARFNCDEKTIYHYTSFENFINIINSQIFYFTPSQSLNDTKELKHGFMIIKKIITDNKFPKWDYCVKVLERVLENINFYICSFSNAQDNLSLWRLYGDNGHGIAIGVNSSFDLVEPKEVETPTIVAVIYQETYLIKAIGTLCKKIQKITKSSNFRTLSNVQKENCIRSLGITLSSFALCLSVISKSKNFEHETEVRLILNDGEISHRAIHTKGFEFPLNRFVNKQWTEKASLLNEDLQLSSNTIKKNKNCLQSAKLDKNFLQEVWIGSKVNENQLSRIRELLFLKGYSADIIIKKVDLPY